MPENLETKREIPPPDPDRAPMMVNAFEAARQTNTALAPMFPYCDDGCLVPGVSVFFGGEDRGIGVFNHTNSVDEVAIVLASQNSRIRTGDIFSGAREHMVGAFFENEDDKGNLIVIVVTQRQSDAGVKQNERLTFMCEKCQTVLLSHDYAAKTGKSEPGYSAPLETLTEGAECLQDYNTKAELRVCPQCKHQNPPFPLHMWGWDNYRLNHIAAARGRASLLSAAAEASRS